MTFRALALHQSESRVACAEDGINAGNLRRRSLCKRSNNSSSLPTRTTEVKVENFTEVPVWRFTSDLVQVSNELGMGSHPSLEPYEFLGAL